MISTQRSRPSRIRRDEFSSLLFTFINYFCYLIFFIFLLLYLDHQLIFSWIIVFSPILPANLMLLYLMYQDIIKIRENMSYVLRTKLYCSILDSLCHVLTTLLLLLYLLKLSYLPVTFSAILTPQYTISLITLSIRLAFLPSPSSREWNQGLEPFVFSY